SDRTGRCAAAPSISTGPATGGLDTIGCWRNAVKKLEVFAIPAYFATMGAEYLHHRARAGRLGGLPGDYERRDTLTSLTMGTASLLVPLVAPKLLAPITPGKGRHGKKLVAGVAAAAA